MPQRAVISCRAGPETGAVMKEGLGGGGQHGMWSGAHVRSFSIEN